MAYDTPQQFQQVNIHHRKALCCVYTLKGHVKLYREKILPPAPLWIFFFFTLLFLQLLYMFYVHLVLETTSAETMGYAVK